MAGQHGFFDLSDRYEALSAAGDPLERLRAVVDFEVFRGPLVVALRREARGKGDGRREQAGHHRVQTPAGAVRLFLGLANQTVYLEILTGLH